MTRLSGWVWIDGASLLHIVALLKSVVVPPSTKIRVKVFLTTVCPQKQATSKHGGYSICTIQVRKVQNVELVLASQLSRDLYGSFVEYVSCGPALRV